MTGESVASIEDSRDTLRVIYDAYERNDFIAVHEGSSPEDLHVDPVLCEHPRTHEAMTLFPVQGNPHFQFICDYALGTTRKQNRMLQPVYQEQGKHTFDFFKTRLPSSVRNTNPPPPRGAMLTKMKELAAKRNPNLRQSSQGVKTEPKMSTGFVHAPSPVALSAPNFFPPKVPTPRVTGKPSLASSKVAQGSMPTCAKSAPATPAGSTARMAPAASAVIAPLGNVKFVVSKHAVDKGEVKQELLGRALGLKRPAEEVAGDAKQQKAAVNTQAGGEASVLRRYISSCPLSPAKPAASGRAVVDLAKVGRYFAASPQSKDANKFENSLKPLDLIRILSGANIEKDITSARRMLGIAKRESPDQWALRMEERLDYIAGCKEIVRSRIMFRTKLEPVFGIIERVQTAFVDERLPLAAWSDWVCCFEAFKYLRPYKPTSDLMGLLKALKLYSSTKQERQYCHTNPTWFLEHIPDQECIDGIVAERFVDFMESVVIPRELRCGIQAREQLEEFLCAIVAMIDGLPELYRASNVLEPFKTRVLGALCACGRTPFLAGSSSVHAQALMSEHKNSALLKGLKEADWSNNLLGSVFMDCIGEKDVWPAMAEQVKALRSGSDASIGFSALHQIFAKYELWATQIRDGALEIYLHSAVLQWCEEVVRGKRVVDETTMAVSLDINDATLISLLKYLLKCKQLSWPDVKLNQLLTELSSVAAAQRAMDDQANLAACCAIGKGELTASSDEQFHAFASKLDGVLPAQKGHSILLTGQSRERVLDTLIAFGEVLLQRWPCHAAYQCVVLLQERFEIDVSVPRENSELDLKKLVQQMRTNFVAFRRMQGFVAHLEEVLSFGDFKDDSAVNDSSSKLLQKLNLYVEFSAPMKTFATSSCTSMSSANSKRRWTCRLALFPISRPCTTSRPRTLLRA